MFVCKCIRFLIVTIAAIFLVLSYLGCATKSTGTGRLYYAECGKLVEQEVGSGKKRIVLHLDCKNAQSRIVRTHYDVSPDNKIIAYEETEFTRDKAGRKSSTRCLVVFNRQKNESVFRRRLKKQVLFPVSISPGAKMIAYVCSGSDAHETPTLTIINLNGKTVLQSIPAYNAAPTWSLNGSQIGISDIYTRPVLINVTNGRKCLLPGHGIPIWAPDGNMIAVSGSYLWRTGTGMKTPLSLPKRAIVTGWTPDSSSILYTKEETDLRYPLYSYNINSGRSTLIIPNHGGSDTYPTIWRK